MTAADCGIHLRGWLRVVVCVGVLLFLFSIIYGPYLSYTTQQNTNKTVNFIHQVQTSKAEQVSRDASVWEIRSLLAICTAVHADCPALPADIRRALRAG